MGTEILNLEHELEQAKNSLKNVDEHLKKLIGRDPSELPPRVNKKAVLLEKGRPGIKNVSHGRVFTFENVEPPSKRRNTSVFNRLSDKVPEVSQKGLISKVIVTPKEIPSREAALIAQNKDEKFRARNRRMFGALLGTLQKFQQEETKLKPKEEKRAQVEKKIEEHEIKEKEEIRRERQELFLNRKKKQAEIKIIELKMLRMKEYNAWEENQKPRKKFILTKSKPCIHFLPRKLNDKTRELLDLSKAEVERLIETKKLQITEELHHIEERIKCNFDSRVAKPDGIETGEKELQDTDEQFEYALTESQVAVTDVNNFSNDIISKENKCQEELLVTEPSENSAENNSVKEIDVINKCGEELDYLKKNVSHCEIEDEVTKNIPSVNHQTDVTEIIEGFEN